jgi:Family of unknown function (DUF6308)
VTIADLRGCAAMHLARYTDADGDRAFRVYDRQGDPTIIAPLDCLAPALLSVRVDWRQVIPLFQPSGPGAVVMKAMQAVLDDPGCSRASFLDIDLCDGDGPWALVDAAIRSSGGCGQGNPVPGLKAVGVSKILHRKRPALIPIFDRWVYQFYLGAPPPVGSYGKASRRLWPLLQADLRANRAWLASLAAPVQTPDGRRLSVLRAADIIIWEHMSTGCPQDDA